MNEIPIDINPLYKQRLQYRATNNYRSVISWENVQINIPDSVLCLKKEMFDRVFYIPTACSSGMSKLS